MQPMDELVRRDLDVLWHPCSQMTDYQVFPPLPVVAAEGVTIELADGQRLYDVSSSWWCKAFGHRHPALTAALHQQADSFEHVILANTTNAGVVRLCERLVAAANGEPAEVWSAGAPAGRRAGHFGRVFLGDNGSTGVEIALKLALQAQRQRGQPGRTRFAALRNGYHGETIATLAVGDCGLYGDPFRSLMFPVTMLEPLPYRSGPDDPAWLDCAAEWPAIEAQLNAQRDELCGIVYEPVLQGAGGMLVYSPELLTRLRRWADANEVYLIADEIAAGMGRCGRMLASHHAEAALPDFAVVSKGLTGGYLPLSAVLTTDTIYELFLADYAELKAFMHSNTYTGNALAVAVANAALDVFADGLLDNVATVGAHMRSVVALELESRPWCANLRGVGMMLAFDLRDRDGGRLDAAARTGWHVYRAAVERGALLRNLGDSIYFFPPLITTADEIDAIVAIAFAAIDSVVAS